MTAVWMRAKDHFSDTNIAPHLIRRGMPFRVNDETRAKDFEKLAEKVSDEEAATLESELEQKAAPAPIVPLGTKSSADATEKVVETGTLPATDPSSPAPAGVTTEHTVATTTAPAGVAGTQVTQNTGGLTGQAGATLPTPSQGAKDKGTPPANKSNPKPANKSR